VSDETKTEESGASESPTQEKRLFSRVVEWLDNQWAIALVSTCLVGWVVAFLTGDKGSALAYFGVMAALVVIPPLFVVGLSRAQLKRRAPWVVSALVSGALTGAILAVGGIAAGLLAVLVATSAVLGGQYIGEQKAD
jgi:hypothetical protein